VQLTVALRDRGHTVRVLAPITPDGVEFDRDFVPTLGGVRVDRYLVPYYLYIYSSVPFDERYRRLERRAIRKALPALIEAEPPDVIVAAQEPLAWYVPQIAKEHGVPCVLLLRGDPTWRIVQGDFPAKETSEWLEAFDSADRIVAVAEYFADGVRNLGLEKISAIPNHVDLSRFAPAAKDPRLLAELGIGQGQVVVAHISKIEPRKRPLDVVASAVEALRVCPDLAYLIVGEGPLLHEMEAACRRAAVADRFRFTRWVDYSAMPTFFNLADVVAQPSEGEGMSRAYLESMACGRVLVASDIPAAREVVRDSRRRERAPVSDSRCRRLDAPDLARC
jgi:glycosyltransferase involved in cell wall biosynthesis